MASPGLQLWFALTRSASSYCDEMPHCMEEPKCGNYPIAFGMYLKSQGTKNKPVRDILKRRVCICQPMEGPFPLMI